MRYKLIGLAAVLWLAASCGAPAPAAKIVFESERDGKGEIYVMNSDGSDLVNLTNNPAWDGLPAWSPDGQRIVFTSDRSGVPEVWVMDSDGGNVGQLTQGEDGASGAPVWSPGGDQIAFVSDRTYRVRVEGGELEVPGNTKIWVMPAPACTCGAGTGGTDRPSIAAQGPGQAQVGAVRRSRQLGLDFYPSWSPDSEKIAFMSVRDGNGEIYVVDSDRFEVNLTNDPAEDWSPAWSPDGQKILFMSDRDGNREIHVMNADGTDPVNLTNHPANDGDPAWSPDGSKILFTSDRDGNAEIYVMNVDGSNLQRLTNHPADDIHPHWQPSPRPNPR